MNLKKALTTTCLALLIIVSAYVGFLAIYPKIFLKYASANFENTEGYTNSIDPDPTNSNNDKAFNVNNALIIPKLQLKEKIYQGDESSLDLGIWQKYADRSNPVLGGNFILTGHRFNFGLTPESTLRKSPLYNVDELKKGDEIIVEWDNKQYKYKISRIFQVKPTQIEIEEDTYEHQLTLYTCTLKGSYDGRVVVIADPQFNAP